MEAQERLPLPCEDCITLAICKSKFQYLIINGNNSVVINNCSILQKYLYQDTNSNNLKKRLSEFSVLFDVSIINIEMDNYIYSDKHKVVKKVK